MYNLVRVTRIAYSECIRRTHSLGACNACVKPRRRDADPALCNRPRERYIILRERISSCRPFTFFIASSLFGVGGLVRGSEGGQFTKQATTLILEGHSGKEGKTTESNLVRLTRSCRLLFHHFPTSNIYSLLLTRFKMQSFSNSRLSAQVL